MFYLSIYLFIFYLFILFACLFVINTCIHVCTTVPTYYDPKYYWTLPCFLRQHEMAETQETFHPAERSWRGEGRRGGESAGEPYFSGKERNSDQCKLQFSDGWNKYQGLFTVYSPEKFLCVICLWWNSWESGKYFGTSFRHFCNHFKSTPPPPPRRFALSWLFSFESCATFDTIFVKIGRTVPKLCNVM